MPVLNQDKCFAQQPQRVNVTVPEELLQDHSDQWLIDFREQLAIRLNLSNERPTDQERSQKEEFFYHLNRHAGSDSSYFLLQDLRASLKHLYCFYKGPKTRPHQQYMIAKGLYEDAAECSAGFHNRVLFIQTLLNEPTTLDELLAQVRFHLVDKIARVFIKNNTQGVHVHNRIFEIAHQSGYGVWALNKADLYRNTGSSNVSDETLQYVLKQGFDTHFHLFGLLNAMCKQLEALFSTWGYESNYTKEDQKEYKEYDRFSKLTNQFTTILDGDLSDYITDDENLVPKVLGINWQKVKYALLQTLCDKNYLTLSPAEATRLDALIKNCLKSNN